MYILSCKPPWFIKAIHTMLWHLGFWESWWFSKKKLLKQAVLKPLYSIYKVNNLVNYFTDELLHSVAYSARLLQGGGAGVHGLKWAPVSCWYFGRWSYYWHSYHPASHQLARVMANPESPANRSLATGVWELGAAGGTGRSGHTSGSFLRQCGLGEDRWAPKTF